MATRKQRKQVKFSKNSLDTIGKEGKRILRTVTPYVKKGISSVYGTMASTTNLAIKQINRRKNKTRKIKK
jgi:hypothetical protein